MTGDEIWISFAMGGCGGLGVWWMIKNGFLGLLIDIAVGFAGSIAAVWAGDRLGVQIGPGVIPEFVNAAVGGFAVLAIERLVRWRFAV